MGEVDLFAHPRFDANAFFRIPKATNAGVRCIVTGATFGEGVEERCTWRDRSGG